MDSIDHTILQAINQLRLAVPNPLLWSGQAASACAKSIEELIAQLESLRIRLGSWVM